MAALRRPGTEVLAGESSSGPYRALRVLALALLGLIAIFVEIAPTGFRTDALPSPDILFVVVAYWAVRRPGSTPILLVFALGLCRDLLADLPVGAGALVLVFAAEFLRTQGSTLARQSFLIEWATVSATAFAVIAAQVVLVVITLAQPPYLLDLLRQGLYTAAIYPVIALCLRWVLRVGWRRESSRRGERGSQARIGSGPGPRRTGGIGGRT